MMLSASRSRSNSDWAPRPRRPVAPRSPDAGEWRLCGGQPSAEFTLSQAQAAPLLTSGGPCPRLSNRPWLDI
jgi:hypothetical protein